MTTKEKKGPADEIENAYPLSPSQQGILFHALEQPDAAIYVHQVAYRTVLSDVEAYVRAWRRVIQRHSALRSSVRWEKLTTPIQIVMREVTLPVQRVDWSGMDAASREVALDEYLAADSKQTFELGRAPLLRLMVADLGGKSFQIVWSFHHIVLDGWSLGIVLAEAQSIYLSMLEGRELDLAPSRPYADYINWLREQDAGAAEAFWREILRNVAEPTSLRLPPVARPGPDGKGQHGEVLTFVPQEAMQALGSEVRTRRLTLNTLVQAAWGLLLSRYAPTDDVVFGMVVAGRPLELEGVQTMVGMLVSTLPLRLTVDGSRPSGAWLQEVHQRLALVRQYEATSLVDIQGWSDIPRDAQLFDAIVAYENYPLAERGDTEANVRDVKVLDRTNYQFALTVSPSGRLRLAYDRNRVDDAAAERMLGQYRRLLTALTEDPERCLADVSMLEGEEERLVRDTWNDIHREFPKESIARIFDDIAGRHGKRCAVTSAGESLSYEELRQRANRLANHLRKNGVEEGTLVGVFLERGVDLVVALLGIVKAGGAYLPLDTSYPQERLAFMLDDTSAPVLLTTTSMASALPSYGGRLVLLDQQHEVIAAEAATAPATGCDAESLAYVMYTSGSTGRPKGVAIPHRGVVRLVRDTDYVELGPQDKIAQAANTAFDATTFEIWGALLNGGESVVFTKEDAMSPQRFAAQLRERGVTAMFVTTALFNQLSDTVPDIFASLRYLLFGGEAVNPERVRAVLESGAPDHLLHVYGPTENTTFSTWHEVREVPAGARTVPIGRGLANSPVYVLDRSGRLSPVGVVGELYLGGAGLARGYHARPQLTAERFVPDPFGGVGATLYRTGDLVRWNDEGAIEFVGRDDGQVKVRGFRIELGEIEEALVAQESVREAVVSVREDEPGDKQLVAYVVLREGGTSTLDDVRGALGVRLPDYMVPAAFVALDVLPITPNGKVDRKALAALETSTERKGAAGAAPRTPVEIALCGIWQQVLRVDRVGIYDGFFELGGDSIRLIRVFSRLQEAFEVRLPLSAIFEAPTIEQLAKHIEKAWRGSEEPPPIQRVPRKADMELSFAQQRLWFLDQRGSGAAYNTHLPLLLRGHLDLEVLARAIQVIVDRHETLRTTFRSVRGKPYQRIAASLRIELEWIDLSDRPLDAAEAELQRVISKQALQPFDISEGPLIRPVVARLAADHHALLITLHHLVVDGWSLGVFMRELAESYTAYSRGETADLPELAIQSADHAVWQRQWLTGELLETQLGYWRQQLADAPSLQLPIDFARPAQQAFHGARCRVHFGRELTDAIEALSRREGATTFMTLLAGFSALLQRYTGQDDLVIGSANANRHRAEIEGLVGFFVNSLVLRTDLSGDPTFRELVGRVRRTALGAYTHQDLPFEMLVEELAPERDPSRNPIFQVMFALQNAPMEKLSLGDLQVSLIRAKIETTRFDLEVHLWEEAGGLEANFVYNTDLFRRDTIERMAEHYRLILQAAVQDSRLPVSEFPLMSEEDSRDLVASWRSTAAPYPRGRSLPSIFEEVAARFPERVAVVLDDQEWTYAELDRRSNQLAHFLGRLGVTDGTTVGLFMDRGLDTILGTLAIVKAGGVYVPLDTSYPTERLAFMLRDTATQVLLSTRALASDLPHFDGRVVLLDEERVALESEPTTAVPHAATAESLAYLMYTSGSTGRPKGVMVPHRGITRLVFGVDYARFDDSRVFLQLAPTSFDAATLEIWGPLLHGGKLVLYPSRIPTVPELGQQLQRHGVTTLWLTASLYNMVIDESPEVLAGVEELLVGGEALSVSHIRKGQECLPNTQLINGYGPTESTTFTCCHRIPRDLPRNLGSIPIGRPIANSRVYVLDDQGQPMPVGMPGELCIGGDGLALGYWSRPALTAERFVPDPFGDGERLYRTGDRVRYLEDGTIEFLGRQDEQVKVRGFRIELGEIEQALVVLPAVREAIVLAREDEPGDKRLVAYVVPAPQQADAAISEDETAWSEEHIGEWQVLYEQTYGEAVATVDPTFDTSGWNSSYTGEPIPAEEMREWTERTVERIRRLRPRRGLEIGCGTGLLLNRLAPEFECYVGTDFSQVALDRLGELMRARADLGDVRLECRLADDFSGIEAGSFDVAIVNSVTQYLPGMDYLQRVVDGAVRAMAPGGHVFLGDLRHRPLLHAFHASVQLERAQDHLTTKRLLQRIRGAAEAEPELLIDPSFFHAVMAANPRVTGVDVLIKRGRHGNEMARYRYDVVLHVEGARRAAPIAQTVDWKADGLDLDALGKLLADSDEPAMVVRRIPNARVFGSVEVLRLLQEPDLYGTAGELRRALGDLQETAVAPEDLWAVAESAGWSLELTYSGDGDDGRVDAVLRRGREDHRAGPFVPPVAAGSSRPWATYGNNPLKAKVARDLVPRLREQLAEQLPEYMVPTAFVVLGELPLNPNGKTDRRALPAPGQVREDTAGEFVAPRSDAEHKLAKIWADILQIDRVGVFDDFFDLGGHSLMATRVVSRVRQDFDVELPLQSMFETPSVAALAEEIENVTWAAASPAAHGTDVEHGHL